MEHQTTNKELRLLSYRDLLFYALSVEGEGDPRMRILASVHQELATFAALALTSYPGAELDVGELGATLEGIGRRLEVVIEMLRRQTEPMAAPPHEGCV